MAESSKSGAKPFLKWAGGKRQLLAHLTANLPGDFTEGAGRYHEPFLGSGALFFALSPERARLADTNADLILCYRVVQQQLQALVERLAQLSRRHKRKPRETYYATRTAFNQRDGRRDDVLRAARLIYLNRTCFNGLYRVNRKGEFNVPMGSYKNPSILQLERLETAHRVLQSAELVCCSFQDSFGAVDPDDFVYVDPPYVPVSRTANFTAYTNKKFGVEQQERLAAGVGSLAASGVRVMVSNAEHPHVRELYDGHHILHVRARRSINSRADKRGHVGEVIILAGYDAEAATAPNVASKAEAL